MKQSPLYVPVLKWRQGEYKALKQLADDLKAKVVPLIEIPPIAWDFVEEQPQKSVTTHLEPMPNLIREHWTGKCFIDFRFLITESVPTEQSDAGQSAEIAGQLVSFFDSLKSTTLTAVPVTAPSRDAAFQDAVREIANREQTGVCIRLSLEDAFGQNALMIGAVLGIKPELIDVVVDLRRIDSSQLALLRIVLKGMLGNSLDQGYRSVALVGSSFPADLSEITPGIGSIARSEWTLWNQLRSELATPLIAFGDYAISHVDVREIDPRLMVASASIRYTTENEWLIFRGRSLREIRFGGYSQFRALSNQVVSHTAYSGPSFSWGDDYLFKCAYSLAGTGNLTTWRQVGTNHHITLVARQLASLPDS